MPKCKSCSKKGLLLRLTGGLCQKCLEKSRLKIVFTEAPTTSKTLTREEKDLLSQISKINAQGEVLPNELYQQLRTYEVNWLERNYDLNSIEGIERIPVSKSVPRPPAPDGGIKTHTGEVYYYLRHKAYEHEDAGNMDLAIACLKKSVAILKCIGFYNVEECYPLVKMLARAGYVEEAYKEKADIEKRCINVHDLAQKQHYYETMIETEAKRGQEARDFAWIQEHIPDKCPKSVAGYRRMKTQNTTNFQALKQAASELGYALT